MCATELEVRFIRAQFQPPEITPLLELGRGNRGQRNSDRKYLLLIGGGGGNRKGVHSNEIRYLQPKQVPQECLRDFRLLLGTPATGIRLAPNRDDAVQCPAVPCSLP